MFKVSAVALLLALSVQADAALVQRGASAPAISAADVAGKAVRLADLKGKEHVLLVFWSGETCSVTEDLTSVEKLRSGLKGKPLAVLGVSVDGTKAAKLAKWLKGKKITFTNLVDEKSKIADDYGVVITPTFLLVDKDGTIQSRYAGGGDRVMNALTKDIEELVRDGSVTAREEPAPSVPSG